jgi:hypothetical protein
VTKTIFQTDEDLDHLLTMTENSFLDRGFHGTTLESVSHRSRFSIERIQDLYSSALDLQVAMLNREFARMYQGIVADVERDPRGGLLSRMYTYMFTQVYERPVARTLYMIDRDALHDLMAHQHAKTYVPNVTIHGELTSKLQEAGMIKHDLDPLIVAASLSVLSGGLALTAPHENLGDIVENLLGMVGRTFDADVTDTGAGKIIFYNWATSLDSSIRQSLHS